MVFGADLKLVQQFFAPDAVVRITGEDELPKSSIGVPVGGRVGVLALAGFMLTFGQLTVQNNNWSSNSIAVGFPWRGSDWDWR